MGFLRSNPLGKRGLLRTFSHKILPFTYQKFVNYRFFSLSAYFFKDDVNNKENASTKMIINCAQKFINLKNTNDCVEKDTVSELSATEENCLALEQEQNETNEDVENTESSLSKDPDWYLNETFGPLTLSGQEKSLPRWMTDFKNAPSSSVEPGPISAELLTRFLKEQHSQNVVTLDVRSRCEWTKFMIIAQGQSLRHLQAMSDSTQNFVKLCKPFDSELPETITLEGESNDEWIVLDAGNIIVHFMTESSRNLYQLEELWTQELQENSNSTN